MSEQDYGDFRIVVAKNPVRTRGVSAALNDQYSPTLSEAEGLPLHHNLITAPLACNAQHVKTIG